MIRLILELDSIDYNIQAKIVNSSRRGTSLHDNATPYKIRPKLGFSTGGQADCIFNAQNECERAHPGASVRLKYFKHQLHRRSPARPHGFKLEEKIGEL